MSVKRVTKGIYGVVKHVFGLHYKSSKVVKLEIGLHQGCLDSDQEGS